MKYARQIVSAHDWLKGRDLELQFSSKGQHSSVDVNTAIKNQMTLMRCSFWFGREILVGRINDLIILDNHPKLEYTSLRIDEMGREHYGKSERLALYIEGSPSNIDNWQRLLAGEQLTINMRAPALLLPNRYFIKPRSLR